MQKLNCNAMVKAKTCYNPIFSTVKDKRLQNLGAFFAIS